MFSILSKKSLIIFGAILTTLLYAVVARAIVPIEDVITISDTRGGSEEVVNFKKIDEGESLSFTVNCGGKQISAKNMPLGASLTSIEDGTWLFHWRPGDTQSGEYTIGFYAQGDSDLIYETVRIIVSNSKFMVSAGEEFSYLFTATDPDDDNVELTLTGIPAGATFTGSRFNPKLFTWTPTLEQVGIHNLVLTATDSPSEGEAKTDISNIEIIVTLLPKEAMPFDFNRDGKINMFDFSAFAQHWLDGVPQTEKTTTSKSLKKSIEDTIVYKTSIGAEYHKLDCASLTGASIQSTIGECKKIGLKPCDICKPDDANYDSYPKKPLENILKDLFTGIK